MRALFSHLLLLACLVSLPAAAGLSVSAGNQAHNHADAASGGADIAAIPAGVVMDYAAATAPSGWLIGDGSAVSRTTYANLFTAIGTTWGAGDGSTTFNLPDCRGRVRVGAGQGSGLTNRALAATGGAETHQLAESEIPSHAHRERLVDSANSTPGTLRDLSHESQASGGSATGNVASSAAIGDVYAGFDSNLSGTVTAVTTGSTGGGTAHNIMQPFIVFSCIIRY